MTPPSQKRVLMAGFAFPCSLHTAGHILCAGIAVQQAKHLHAWRGSHGRCQQGRCGCIGHKAPDAPYPHL